jgi:small subunit ribosomal protein S6e
MRSDVEGSIRKKLLLSASVGFHPKKRGERKRKSIRGNTISASVSQINAKVIVTGKQPLEKIIGKSGKPAEEKKEEVKEAPKEQPKPEEKPKAEPSQEAPKKEPKPEVKEEAPEEKPKVEEKPTGQENINDEKSQEPEEKKSPA